MKKLKIFPAILSKNFRDYQYKIKTASRFFSGVQIDVMDGRFVKNRTYTNFKKINSLKPKKLFFEIQLMVQDPLKYILAWSSVADRYIIHLESADDPLPFIAIVKGMGKGVGLAINPRTSVSLLRPYIKKIDMVLIMSVSPGKMGQQFIPHTLKKIRSLREIAPKLPIEIDGGIDDKNIMNVVKAGANLIVSGSYLWKSKNILQAKERLLEIAKIKNE